MNDIIINVLTDKELEDLLIDSGSFYDCHNESYKQDMRDAYRKVEAEHNMQIVNAGGVNNWYQRGRC